LTKYVNTQLDQIEDGDTQLRHEHDGDPVHDTRVAIRRLRSTLRVFANALGGPEIADLDGELKWFAALLGDVRDCQVQRRRFGEALDGMPEELILGPVRSRIRNELQAIELPARARLREAMDSERYRALLAALRGWRDEPPVDPQIAVKTLRKRARRAQRKADRRLAAALESGLGSGGAAMLHRARKAAKRARYAAELCRPLDKDSKRTIKHYKQIQSLLGDHQDTVVATEALRQMAVTAGTTVGENGFSYGMLYAREQRIARQCRQEALELV
jgi:CHAD domain-containing protein